MANDVSYFKVQGDDTQYSFNDADAEQNKLSTDGGTMRGRIYMLSSNITDGVTPSVGVFGLPIEFDDSTGTTRIGSVQPYASAAGRQGLFIAGYRNGVSNSISLLVDTGGNSYVNLSDASAWRSALGVAMTYGTYTPTFSWSTSGAPTVESGGTYQWIRFGNVMMVHGRFNITNLNAPSSAGMLQITLPSGVSVVNSVAAVGQMMCSYTHTYDFVCRVATVAGPITVGTAGGAGVSGDMQTGWHNFFAIVFVS